MSEDKKKDILNYESDYGKQEHQRNLLKDRMNIYVENLNIDKFDNSNYGNNITSTGQGNLDLNMDWSIKSTEPIQNNNGLQLPKSNSLSEDQIKNSKVYKDMENMYKEKLKEKESFIDKLINDKKSLINLIKYFKGKVLSDDVFNTIKILMFGGNDNEE